MGYTYPYRKAIEGRIYTYQDMVFGEDGRLSEIGEPYTMKHETPAAAKLYEKAVHIIELYRIQKEKRKD